MNFLLNAVAVSVVLWIVFRLVLRGAVRAAFVSAGQKALAQQPARIHLELVAVPRWRDQAKMEAQAGPLLKLGFQDCGTYVIDRIPAAKLRILLKEDAGAAAFIYEHPQVGVYTEFSVRYEDGTTTALVNRPSTGLRPPPFFRRIEADPAEPTDRLYERLLRERPAAGIKTVTAATVVPEYEDAWRRIMAWEKNQGLSAEDVAVVLKKRLEQKRGD